MARRSIVEGMAISTTDINPKLLEIKDCLYRLSAKAVIIEEQELLMVLEHNDDWWSLPGGGVDYGETTLESLARELSEELGVAIKDIRTDEAPLFVTTHAIVDTIPRAMLYYRVHIPMSSVRAATDVRTFRWCSAQELVDLTKSPSIHKITDKLTSLLQ